MTYNTILNDVQEILAAYGIECHLARFENGEVASAVVAPSGFGSPRIMIKENVIELCINGSYTILAEFEHEEWPTRGGVHFTAVNVVLAITCYLAGRGY